MNLDLFWCILRIHENKKFLFASNYFGAVSGNITLAGISKFLLSPPYTPYSGK